MTKCSDGERIALWLDQPECVIRSGDPIAIRQKADGSITISQPNSGFDDVVIIPAADLKAVIHALIDLLP